jgi:hypothetical protein
VQCCIQAWLADAAIRLGGRYSLPTVGVRFPVYISSSAEAKFLVHNWGDIVNSGIGLSYQPACLCSLAGRYDNPMSETTISPQSGTTNLATG